MKPHSLILTLRAVDKNYEIIEYYLDSKPHPPYQYIHSFNTTLFLKSSGDCQRAQESQKCTFSRDYLAVWECFEPLLYQVPLKGGLRVH
jgi:hypothetical protein